MQIQTERDILDIGIRKQIIEEIKGEENQARKYEAYKRYMIYKDQCDAFVREQLLKQFDRSTVMEMEYCIANVSLVRKVIDKLARVYNNGVTRSIENNEPASQSIENIAKAICINTELKRSNRYLKLQKNLLLYIKPCPIDVAEGEQIQYTIKAEPLQPYLYDAIEYANDRTQALGYILSDFDFNQPTYTTADAATVGRTASVSAQNLPQGDSKDQMIADSPDDAQSQTFVWWTNSYHFTTDEKGQIISESIDNPIKKKPFINYAIDQDGQFWARGGDDLIDGGVLINSILTHNQHVAVTQGYGQFYMKGKNLPKNIKIGPSKAILMEYEEGEPVPDLGYAAANPQIDQLRGLVESYIALLLTTNNLSTSAVAAQLGQNNTAPSGIAMIIDKAESREDVQDQQQVFIDREPEIWDIVRRWMDIYRDVLVPKLKSESIPEDMELQVKFHEMPVVMSESEKLQNLKLRKELGIDTMIDLLMKDNPSLSKQQAEEKLKELMAEKILNSMAKPEEESNSEQEPEEKEQEENGNEIDESDEE